MTWQGLNIAVIEQKLESLRKCLVRVEQKCPTTAATLVADIDAQDIVTVNLTRAVQLCVDIGAQIIAALNTNTPDTMGKTFDVLAEAGVIPVSVALRLKKAVGFRNIAVHNYEVIDWNIVHVLVKRHLSDFTEFARIVAASIK